jgi:hypothetical protein
MEGEASNIWCPETGELKPLAKYFISIGTGNPGKKPFEDSIFKFLGKIVVQIATETENTEKKFITRWAKHSNKKGYFQFNVNQGLQEIGLEEYNKKGAMIAATEGYLTYTAQKFRVRAVCGTASKIYGSSRVCICMISHSNVIARADRPIDPTPLLFATISDVRPPSAKQQECFRLLYKHSCRYEATKNRNAERFPGTCNWFTNHELFKQWVSPTSQGPDILHVIADPGCGESVLSKYLIDSILPRNGRRVCYFFFKDDFEDQKTSLSAPYTLLWQLYDLDFGILIEDILSQYKVRGESLFESFGDLWKIFLSAASAQETVIVI